MHGEEPNSIGYCRFCHELRLCHQSEWGKPGQPDCGKPIAKEPGERRWCANELTPLSGEVGDLILAAFILGGKAAADEVWYQHGYPRLAGIAPWL